MMAGSFSHIVSEEGESFSMEFIENLGDAEEALDETYNLIVFLANGNKKRISAACRSLGFSVPDPWDRI